MPDGELELVARPKTRVVKAPAVRRAELIDCAQALFLQKGYERTTINDVIAATALSKGAFYHHFRAKEDLLEAIAARFAEQAMATAAAVQGDASLTALQRLNALLAMSREWKAENLQRLSADVHGAAAPGERHALPPHRRRGVRGHGADADRDHRGRRARGGVRRRGRGLAAEALLWLGEGRRALVVQAMAEAEAGDVDGAMAPPSAGTRCWRRP